MLTITDRNDNFNTLKEFSNSVNSFFSDIIEIIFFCSNMSVTNNMTIEANDNDKYDNSTVYVLSNSTIIENKSIKYLSQGFLNYLMNKFNLTQHIDAKVDKRK